MKRPNPVNGKTVVAQNPLLVHTKDEMRAAIAHAGLQAKRSFVMNLGISELIAHTTPSSRWKQEGRVDDFIELLCQERGQLCLGNHTDDELAAELFLYGNQSPEERSRSMIQGKPSSIAYLMAGKERIRWLSRHLDASLENEKRLVAEVEALTAKQQETVEQAAIEQVYADHGGLLWRFLVEDHVDRWNKSGLLTNDVIGNDQFDREFKLRILKLLPADVAEGNLHKSIERVARSIYERWVDQPDYREWVVGGNSTKQNKARSRARDLSLFQLFTWFYA